MLTHSKHSDKISLCKSLHIFCQKRVGGKEKMKKLLALLLAMLLLTTLLAGCATNPTDNPDKGDSPDSNVEDSGDSGDSGDEDITINLWHIYIDETDRNRITTEEYIAAYEEAHPNVKIEQHVLMDVDYKAKMLTEFSGNAAGIDVFSYWGAGRAGDFVYADKLLCIEDYLSDEQLASIKPGSDTNFRYDDKLYGLPMSSWMMILYCNEELFEANGAKLPETYDEWLEACQIFADAGIIPVALGGGVDDAWQAAFVYEALVNRIVGAEAENEVLANMAGFADDPGFKEAAEKMMALTAINAFGNSPLEIDELTSSTQFLTGAAAMRLTGSWFTDQIYTLDSSEVEGKVAALPIPMVEGGNGLVTDYVGGFIDGFFINKEVANPDVVADFTYGLCVALGTRQHEIGEGFTAYDVTVDESGLYPLGQDIAAIANNCILGFVAWDTFLPGDLADIHLDATQNLLSARADIDAFMSEYEAIFN